MTFPRPLPSRLRWLMLMTHVPPSGAGGGMIRYVMEMATALHSRPDVELHVVCSAPSKEMFESRLGVGRAHVLPALPTTAMSLIEREALDRLVVRGRFDVVHGAKNLLPRRAAGALRLLTVHDMLLLDRPTDFGRVKSLLVQAPYLSSARAADAIVCVSAATRDRLCAYLPEVAARAHVVPVASPRALLDAAPVPVEGLVPGRFAVVVGDPTGRKNVALATGVWGRVREAHPDAVLAVIGPSGWGATSFGAAAGRLVDEGAVRLMGHIDDGALRWAYENAAVALCPSLAEGFGAPSVEAGTLGAPVITSDDPAMCEVSGAEAVHISALDTDAWAAAVIDHLSYPRERRPRPPDRTYADVADETVAVVRDAA
ncbi:glycosyltransferase family 4 protein [Motilibacter aurantiacus]|uniref:glycosyltransferase family 4 protein n=1 Tax=Motilibacter aurantiacus TaxID=2714955 RepID=UPI00140B28BA|nr:glycosyltransferase family 1 protein [Motilibacter aurantiacus]NHC44740.1 glycosyltransferase family 4 protein [Motilibacter aurantiacus]